jgi:ABC-type uncharacterized transport system substrate-binding protein
MPYELRTVDLDAKNKNQTEIRREAKRALDLVSEWKPDLIFLTDDLAQSEIGVPLKNSGIPIVFCGVNKSPADYGYDKATNVSGVMETEHTSATMSLLKNLIPGRRIRIAIVIDDDPTWIGVVGRMKEEIARDPDLDLVRIIQPATFEEFKKEMITLQTQADALGMLGVFRFADGSGKLVDYEKVLQWTTENSKLPDFSFWDTRVERGTLCAVTVSGIEQGKSAGVIARRILVDRVLPSSIPYQTTTKGIPMISLARANALGIKASSSLLLNTKVLSRYIWENR